MPEEKRYSGIDSCFTTRQDDLIEAIRGKEIAVAVIGIDSDKKLCSNFHSRSAV